MNVVYDRPCPNGHSGVVGRPRSRPWSSTGRRSGDGGRSAGPGRRGAGSVIGSRPPGSASPARTSAIASGPASPGTQASEDRGAVLGRPRERQRPAAHDHQHDRRAGGDDRLEQLLLAAEEAEVDAGRGTRPSWRRRSGRTARRARRSRRRRRAASADRLGDLLVRPVPQARSAARARRARHRTGRGARRRIVGRPALAAAG